MSTHDADHGALLPTVFSAYLPVEEYLEQLAQSGVAAGAAAQLRPMDGAVLHFLAALSPARPTVLDLAGPATGGASTVLCGAQARAGRVVVVRPGPGRVGGEPWRPVAQRVLDGLRPAAPLEEA